MNEKFSYSLTAFNLGKMVLGFVDFNLILIMTMTCSLYDIKALSTKKPNPTPTPTQTEIKFSYWPKNKLLLKHHRKDETPKDCSVLYCNTKILQDFIINLNVYQQCFKRVIYQLCQATFKLIIFHSNWLVKQNSTSGS